MGKKLFVGGLSWGTTEDRLRQAFADYGVLECKIITHRDGEHEGKSKGFGFVTLERGDAALAEMEGFELDSRYLRVHEAHDQRNGGSRKSAGGSQDDRPRRSRRDRDRAYR